MTDLIPAPRPVPTTEDRMRDATAPTEEHAAARAFNDAHPIGTPVRYWKGAREGDGKVSRTRTPAQLLSGHTAVVWLENVSGCIALTHIQPISEDEFAATPAEQWPAAATGRSFAAYLTAQERDQLDARAACAEQERDEALDDRNALRQQLDTARAELGAAQELLAVVDDLAEQLDRARARYATRPSEPGLGSAPPRAQEDRPPVVVLCGSTRFREDFHRLNRHFTLTGCIVLAPGVFGHADGVQPTEEQKTALDALHFRKIDMADRVFVVNPGGYIGESTRREIAYAERTGKPVGYWKVADVAEARL